MRENVKMMNGKKKWAPKIKRASTKMSYGQMNYTFSVGCHWIFIQNIVICSAARIFLFLHVLSFIKICVHKNVLYTIYGMLI